MGLSTVDQFKHLSNEELIVPNDAQLHQLQRVLFMMGKDITNFCEERGLNYHLGGGTALGAVRHKGFIPWDDDLDINMPRKDYDVFVAQFATSNHDKYIIQSPETTPGYRSWGARVRLKGTELKDREDVGTKDSECGIWVDIFPVENTYDNTVLRYLHGLICMALGFICSCTRTYQDRNYYYSLAGHNASLTKSLKIKATIGLLFSFRSFNAWMKTSVRWYSKCRNNDTQYVVIPSGRKHFFGETYLRSDMIPTRKQQFETEQWDVPIHVESYLEKLYGDWKILPPESGREHHALIALDLGKYADFSNLESEREVN
jgi:lipopolysaccharide cholinephosphotransferase